MKYVWISLECEKTWEMGETYSSLKKKKKNYWNLKTSGFAIFFIWLLVMDLNQ